MMDLQISIMVVENFKFVKSSFVYSCIILDKER
jgi:hypothetical protein